MVKLIYSLCYGTACASMSLYAFKYFNYLFHV